MQIPFIVMIESTGQTHLLFAIEAEGYGEILEKHDVQLLILASLHVLQYL